jgi:hypothetical protein
MVPEIVLSPVLLPPRVRVRVEVTPARVMLKFAAEKVRVPLPLLMIPPAPP